MSKAPDVQITHVEREGRLVVAVVGDLDLGSSGVLEAAFAALAPFDVPVVIDLDRIGFIDSSGMRTLLTVNEIVSAATGSPVTLAGGSPATKRLLDLTGLAKVLRLEP